MIFSQRYTQLHLALFDRFVHTRVLSYKYYSDYIGCGCVSVTTIEYYTDIGNICGH